MTLLGTTRTRIAVAAMTLTAAALLCVFFLHSIANVQAAKQAILSEDARVGSQLATQSPAHPNATPVLVELFTSEGCSSCPPADALLARLQLQQPIPSANIIVLEEHVDYWESLGWHDRFSARQFTDRQTVYAQRLRLDDNYTPQMIVDGIDQFVGNGSAHALRAITQAALTPKLPLALSAVALNGNHLTGTVSIPPSAALPKAGLYAALIEPTASTKVLYGENGGHTLNHVSVVRSLQRLGPIDALSPHEIPFTLEIPKELSPANFRLVVFAQASGQGEILAAISSVPLVDLAPVKPFIGQNKPYPIDRK